MKAILISGFRADVGSYIIYSYPEGDYSHVDVMNIYNLHRFRTTERNFQIISQGGVNIASYYSGFRNTNYIGKADHVVSLLLDENENPNEYDKILIKVTNNLLTQMDDSDFEFALREMYLKLDARNFDKIKVLRGAVDLEEAPVEKKKIATTSSATLTDEEKIFEELLESSDLDTSDNEFDSKLADFQKSGADPFSGGAAADPFSGGPRDIFSENPFDAAQKPSFEKAVGIDEAIGKQMFQRAKSTAADIIGRIDKLESSRPQKPAGSDQDTKYKYLEDLVSFLEQKVRILSNLASQVKTIEASSDEKDQIIGKLLLLFQDK